MNETVWAWFIGGPWNNRLVSVSAMVTEIRIPLFTGTMIYPYHDAKALEEPRPCVDYYRQADLPTGAHVFSCLVGGKDREFCRWDLPSFDQPM